MGALKQHPVELSGCHLRGNVQLQFISHEKKVDVEKPGLPAGYKAVVVNQWFLRRTRRAALKMEMAALKSLDS